MTRRRARGDFAKPVTEGVDTPPTRISVEWDFWYASVLVDRSPGAVGADLLDPVALGLSPELVSRLAQWLERQELLSKRWMRGEPDTEHCLRVETELSRQLRTLAHDVQHEMGSGTEVLLRGRPLDEHYRPERGIAR